MPPRSKKPSHALTVMDGPFNHSRKWYEAIYLDMGPARSIDKLYRLLLIDHPNERHPKCETLRDWCKDEKWRLSARYYDRGREDERKKAFPYDPSENTSEALRSLNIFNGQAIEMATQALGSRNPEDLSIKDTVLLLEMAFKGMDTHDRLRKSQQADEKARRLAQSDEEFQLEWNSGLARATEESLAALAAQARESGKLKKGFHKTR